MIVHPEHDSVTRLVQVVEGNLSFNFQSGLLGDAVGEIKGQQFRHITPRIGRILPKWVWLRFNSLGSGSVLANLV